MVDIFAHIVNILTQSRGKLYHSSTFHPLGEGTFLPFPHGSEARVLDRTGLC